MTLDNLRLQLAGELPGNGVTGINPININNALTDLRIAGRVTNEWRLSGPDEGSTTGIDPGVREQALDMAIRAYRPNPIDNPKTLRTQLLAMAEEFYAFLMGAEIQTEAVRPSRQYSGGMVRLDASKSPSDPSAVTKADEPMPEGFHRKTSGERPVKTKSFTDDFAEMNEYNSPETD
jgi:hypothetical protein